MNLESGENVNFQASALTNTMASGALRFLGRVAAAGSQLVSQRFSGVVKARGIGELFCLSQGKSLLPKFSCSWLSSSRIASESSSKAASAKESCTSFPLEHVQDLKHSGIRFPSYGVRFQRTFHSSNASGDGSAPEPLTLAEVGSWLRLGAEQQVLELKSLPIEQRWQFLERLEASGRRPTIVHWTTALHDEAGSLSVEVLRDRVEDLWKKGYQPSAVTYGVLLHACRQQFRLEDALRIYKDMLGHSIQPLQATFLSLSILLKESYTSHRSARIFVPHGQGMQYLRFLLAQLSTWGIPIDEPIACNLMMALGELCKEASLHAEGVKLARETLEAVRNQGLQASDTLCSSIIICYTTRLADMSIALGCCESDDKLGRRSWSKNLCRSDKGLRS